jgi:hypothetical protein
MLLPVPAATVRTMTRNGGSGPAPAGSRGGDPVVLGCVGVALLPVAVLHLSASTTVDPLASTISDYVTVPGGHALLGISAAALAAAGLVLAAALRHSALPGTGVPAALMVSWSAALLVVAVFPTNAPGTPPDAAAAVHRVAGAWVFAVLPLVGVLVAWRARSAADRSGPVSAVAWWSGATAVASLAFLLAHIPVVVLGAPGFPLLGAIQRVLVAAVLGTLLVLARAVRLAGTASLSPGGRAEPVADLPSAA